MHSTKFTRNYAQLLSYASGQSYSQALQRTRHLKFPDAFSEALPHARSVTQRSLEAACYDSIIRYKNGAIQAHWNTVSFAGNEGPLTFQTHPSSNLLIALLPYSYDEFNMGVPGLRATKIRKHVTKLTSELFPKAEIVLEGICDIPNRVPGYDEPLSYYQGAPKRDEIFTMKRLYETANPSMLEMGSTLFRFPQFTNFQKYSRSFDAWWNHFGSGESGGRLVLEWFGDLKLSDVITPLIKAGLIGCSNCISEANERMSKERSGQRFDLCWGRSKLQFRLYRREWELDVAVDHLKMPNRLSSDICDPRLDRV